MIHETHRTSAATTTRFSDAEWQSLQAEDMGAGKTIICLMGGIFVTGLVLYLIVAWWVA